ncbi:MAG: HAD-IIB family hydrolase [Candidatus Taylorbacteria bacterium]
MIKPEKKVVIFSFNGTLVPNGGVLDAEMAELLTKLLVERKVVIISGCGFPKIETQFLNSFRTNANILTNLLILPSSASKMLTWKGAWTEVYTEHIAAKSKEEIFVSLNTALRKLGWSMPEKTFGSVIQDRGTQITFSGLGENAPTELKEKWDRERIFRSKIVEELKSKLPNYDVRIGGLTSVDITKRGVNKGYGIRKVEEYLKVGPESLIFIGDAIFSGGNDFPVKASGIDCIQVHSPDETKQLLSTAF